MKHFTWALLATSMAAGSAAWAGDVPLIPRDVLFGNPDRAAAQISFDGKWISYLAPVDNVMNVWVAPSDDIAKATPITHDKVRGIRQYSWAYDNQHIIYRQDQGGDENWKIYSVPVSGGDAKDLTPFEDIKGPDGKPIMLPSGQPLRPAANISATSPNFPGTIVIGLNNRNPQYHDQYKVDLATGKMDLLEKNDEYAGFVIDDDFKVRLAFKQTEDGGSEILKADGKGGFEPWQKVSMADSLSTQPVDFSKDGKTVYMTDSRSSDTAELTAVNLDTGNREVIASDPKADVGGLLVHPTKKTIQAASFNYEKNEWKVLDKSIQADLDYLKTVSNGEVAVQSRSLDDSKWIVGFAPDDGPAKVYLYERDPAGGKAGKAKFLYTNRTKLEGVKLSPMNPVVIKSRDGLDMVAYVTLPAEHSDMAAKIDGKGEVGGKPLPTILFVHGGPWARDNWGFNPYHQWLANRGYAVISVNYRGSTGFGKKFLNAGNKEWAGKMHDDLIDTVDWAVKKSLADKDKIAIMGGSYGGYATLVGLTFTPDTFACGVDIVGPSNILTLLSTIPPYWQPLVEQFTQRVGDFRSEEGKKFLASRSPINFVDKIKKPLLIGQGKNDPRVKQAEADQIVSAMQGKSIPVTYVLFPDEGHGFARPANNMAFNAITESFLAEHLGGRFQPLGDDVKQSTAQVRTGAEQIPGLANAMGPKNSAPAAGDKPAH